MRQDQFNEAMMFSKGCKLSGVVGRGFLYSTIFFPCALLCFIITALGGAFD